MDVKPTLLVASLAGATMGSLVMSCARPQKRIDLPEPPVARAEPHRMELHGDVRVDDYYWLREREDPEVIAYLEAENEYAETVLAPIQELHQTVYREMRSRIQEDDESVPYERDGSWYYTRVEEDREYPVYCRRRGSMEAPEEILLDVNIEAEGWDFTSVRTVAPSRDGRLLLYAVDHVGRRKYELRVRDLATGEDLGEPIEDVTGNAVWAADSRTLLYTRQHPETLRAYQVFRHRVGADPASAVLVFQEDDEQFFVGVTASKSRDFLLIVSSQTESTEYRVVPAERPEEEPRLFAARRPGHRYFVDHDGRRFFVRTNLRDRNFHLAACSEDDTAVESWRDVVPPRDGVYLADFELFRRHLVLTQRREGLIELEVRPGRPGAALDGEPEGAAYQIPFDEPAYAAYPEINVDLDTTVLRYTYESMITPDTTYAFDLETRQRKLLKRHPVPNYDPSGYRSERLWLTARDGTRVPVSLAYRSDLVKDGRAPLLLYGYGSYGASTDPVFRSTAFSLIDRGFVFALAHVRGGSELGRPWYDAGKLLEKRNTFWDFIDTAEYLVGQGYTAPDRLFARGGSAGGLLMGVIANERPDLFAGIVAGVPFVDVITTMLDVSIPLTTFEFDEWGNPADERFYRYMLQYSPYDNVERQSYPNLLVTTGLHDSQVQYWEPAKWVAKLRRANTGDGVIALKTNMSAGHGGASGRFASLEELALEYAFLIDLAERV